MLPGDVLTSLGMTSAPLLTPLPDSSSGGGAQGMEAMFRRRLEALGYPNPDRFSSNGEEKQKFFF